LPPEDIKLIVVGPGNRELDVIIVIELIDGEKIIPLNFLLYRKGKQCSA